MVLFAGDWVKSKLSSQELTTRSWHGHVTKALRLLALLCVMAPTLPALSSAVAVSPSLRHLPLFKHATWLTRCVSISSFHVS